LVESTAMRLSYRLSGTNSNSMWARDWGDETIRIARMNGVHRNIKEKSNKESSRHTFQRNQLQQIVSLKLKESRTISRKNRSWALSVIINIGYEVRRRHVIVDPRDLTKEYKVYRETFC
jgi:hypothetical protein